jgi:hypothetical protein
MINPVRQQVLQTLLDELCVDLGFCLPADAQARILNNSPADIDAFTDAVIRAEGLDPQAEIPRHLRRDVKARVAKHFSRRQGERHE